MPKAIRDLATAEPVEGSDQPRPALRLGRAQNRFLALGLAVNHLMGKPAYGAVKFNAWSRILAGQINRGHYRFVLDPADRVVGMLGWALADEQSAERWLTSERGWSDASGGEGDCVIFNVWSADTPAARPLLLHAARLATAGCRTLYFRRLYSDGRVRPTRLAVNQFIQRHLVRGFGAPERGFDRDTDTSGR